jgi:hypothetical protein
VRLTCPCCGASYGLEVLLADRSAREAVAAALGLPAGLGERLLRYLGLFRPRERALSWDRAARLLGELNEAVSAAQIERDGRTHPAPVEYWKAAIDQMLDNRDKLSLPLKSHGYLYEIIAGLGQRAGEKRAARQEVAEERERAREGERQGLMRRAGAPTAAGVIETPNGARIDESTGEILTEQRPTRVPPPPEFRALVAKLKGKTDDPPGQTAESPL